MEQGTRPTKTTKTTGGHEVETYDQLTGGEVRMLGFMMKRSESADDDVRAQDQLIKTAVKSLDGSPENIVERINNLPVKEYMEVVAVIDSTIETLNDTEKKSA